MKKTALAALVAGAAAVVLAVLAASPVSASPAVLDYSSVTRWEATPVEPVHEGLARFAEVRGGTKCGKGVCAFENAVCCKESGACCEWGECVETTGVPQCQASSEQNALVLAKAFVKDEATKEVKHEQGLKAKSEAGMKLKREAGEKNTQEQAEKKEATAEEAQAKSDATKQHKERLARQEAAEEANKNREGAAKKRAQAAMVRRFQSKKVTTFNAGRPFNAVAGKCFPNRPIGNAFTLSFWAYNRDDVKFSGVRNIVAASSIELYSRYSSATKQVVGVHLIHPTAGKNRRYESRFSLPVEAWSHVAVVVTTRAVKVYVNKRVVIHHRVEPGFSVAGKRDQVCAGLAPLLDTRIADLRFASAALSAAAIASNFNQANHDTVAASSAVRTIVDGPWSPEAGKKLGANNMVHSGSYSVGLWLRATGLAAEVTNILHKGDSNGGNSMWLNLAPTGAFGRLQVQPGIGGDDTGIGYTITNDKWFHFAFTVSGRALSIYVDGKRVAGTNLPRNVVSVSNQMLYASNPWDKQTPPAPILAANLVFAAKALDAAAIRHVVAQRYDHNYQPEGLQLVKSQDLARPATVPAKSVPHATCRTYAFWVRPTGKEAGWASIFHKGTSSNQRAPAVWFKPNSLKLHIRSGTRSNSNYGLDYDTDLPVDVWSHVAFVHCHNKMQVFINAEAKGEDTKAIAPDTNDGNLFVPKSNWKPAKASIADLRYWTLALNKQMIHKVYEAASHP